MAEKKSEPSVEPAASVEQFGHKNPVKGPKTSNPLPDWRTDRDYENFNPTAEK